MDVQSLLESFGYFIIFLSVFIECGVILGLILPLPGFSLLFTAGVLAATGQMNLFWIILIGTLAAICGYVAGYFTGSKYGRRIFFERETKKYFTAAQGRATEAFMKKWGYWTLIIGRFLPIMHNVAPLLSGIARTPLIPFMVVNVIGGTAWTASAALSGYYIGQVVPNAQYLAIPFIILTIILFNTPYVKKFLNRITKKIEEF